MVYHWYTIVITAMSEVKCLIAARNWLLVALNRSAKLEPWLAVVAFLGWQRYERMATPCSRSAPTSRVKSPA